MAERRLKNIEQTRKFVMNAGVCLRYGSNDALPIASMYEAVFGDTNKPTKEDLKIAIDLTNQLLAKHDVVEVNVIADRVCLVHRSLMPAIYQMVRQKIDSGHIPKLSPQAKKTLSLIQDKGEIVTGDVRKLFGIPSAKTGKDPAYEILGELQHHLLVDRGPFKVSNEAIPYLAKEGYPYHLFTEAHAELAKEASKMSFEEACEKWLLSFLKTTKACSVRKMVSIFKLFLSAEEINTGLELLISRKKVRLNQSGRNLSAQAI
jgi:hypothetical protein